MPRPLNKPWFVVGLGLTAVVLTCRALLPGTSIALPISEGAEAPAETSADRDQPVASAAEIEEALRKWAASGSTLRDPFLPRPAAASATAAKAPTGVEETVQLSAVWIQGAAAFGVVNGRILAAGEAVGRLTIDRITAEGVWFSHWRGRDFVEVGDSFTLVSPADRLGSFEPSSSSHEG